MPSVADRLAHRSTPPLHRLAIANAVSWGVLVLTAIVTAALLYRDLGAAWFGVWATMTSLKGFALLFEGGLSLSATVDVATVTRAETLAVARLRTTWRIAAVCGTVGTVVLLAMAWLATSGTRIAVTDQPIIAVALGLFAIETGIALATSPLVGAARGRERFDAVAVASVAQAVTTVILLITLVPSTGLVGAAIALLVARGAFVAVLVLLFVPTNRGVVTLRGPASQTRSVIAFVLPIWLIAFGTQVGLGTDVIIVAAAFGVTSAGAYAAGAAIPRAAVSLLFALVDTAFPRFVRSRGVDGSERRVLRTATLLAGLGFTVLIVLAPSVLTVWLGSADQLAVDVMRTYAIAWVLNVPAHVLSLDAMARGRQGRLVPIVLVEASVTFMLSVLLAAAGFPLGPAIATLLTIAVSNLLVVPLAVLPSPGLSWSIFTRESLGGTAVGVVAGLAVVTMALALPLASIGTLTVAVVLTGGMAIFLVEFLVRQVWLSPRLIEALSHGGLGTWRRQRREVREARARIAELRIAQPIVFVAHAPPLVTVRIPTYNRGDMVRDRAIASALAQTHPNLEIVVVGDRCDAATEAAVLSVKDPRVRFENLEERGRYPADPRHRWMVAGVTPVNRATDLARGEWIAPLDDDDEFTPDHIEVLLDACRSRDLEFAWGIAEMEVSPGRWEHVGSPDLGHGTIVHAAVLVSRRLTILRYDIDSWRLDEPADWNLWHRMRDAGARMGFVDHVVSRHYLERREIRP